MREILEKVLNEYSKATKETKKGHPLFKYIDKTIPILLKKLSILNNSKYIIKASSGVGRWTSIPWIAVFNKNITTSAQKGLYVIYLFSSDLNSVYLVFEQGTSDIKQTVGTSKIIKYLENKSNELRQQIDSRSFSYDNNLDLKSHTQRTKYYKPGAVFYKKYDRNELPKEEILIEDLEKMLEIYDDYEHILNKDTKDEYIEEDFENIDINPYIFFGPPGTGKTYKMQNEYINQILDKDNCFVTTFHQSYSYEDFIEGLKPVVDSSTSDLKYNIEKGIFYRACEQAVKLAGYKSIEECLADDDKDSRMKSALKHNQYVLFCIDEINRGNISAIFGDLISLIEPSKRIGADNEMIVQLPYSKTNFSVPQNLLIIGTMNTADRSIQLLDSALRRRFKFEQLLPDYDVIDNEIARTILMKINARIRCFLDKDHQIGHAYFIDAKSALDIIDILRDNVIPLLEEYFYNDTIKIRQVLNEYDNDDLTDTCRFYITDSEANKAANELGLDLDESLYYINPELNCISTDELAMKFLNHLK